MTTISVVVCTYNRVENLLTCLQSLAEQTLSRELYEVIVIDNNSTDATSHAVQKYMHDYSNIRYVLEEQQGLSHARNRGWSEATGQYVAYTDDDCKLPTQWLTVALEVIEQAEPDVFGGPYFAFYNTSKPCWFKDTYGSNYGLGQKARFLGAREYLSGGNIFVRRSLLETTNGFKSELGMSGQRLGYGEETFLLRHIRAKMPEQRIYYDPHLYVYHLVKPNKMTIRWQISQYFTMGRYNYWTFQDDSLPVNNIFSVLLKTIFRLLALILAPIYGIFFRDRHCYPYFQNYLIERVLPHLSALGYRYEQYGHLKQHRIR